MIMNSSNRIYLYPLWVRIWHGANALGIIFLIISGLRMQFADVDLFGISFKTAITLHNVAGISISVNYLLFLIGNFVTHNKYHYRVELDRLVEKLKLQSNYYLSGIFRNEPAPFPVSPKQKFNPLQKYVYIAVMYVLVPILIVTGIALLFPELIVERIYSFSGIYLTALLHGAIGLFIFIFLIIHLYIASMGKNPLVAFRSMIDGFHDVSH